MTVLHNASRSGKFVVTAMTTIAGVVILALMFLTAADVILRKFAGEGIRGAVEITEVLLVVAIFLGLTGAEVARIHLRTPIFVDRLPARYAGLLTATGLVIAASATAWATVASADLALTSYQNHEIRYGLLGLPLWPAKATVALGLLGFTIALVANAYLAFRAALTGERITDDREDFI